MGWLCLWIAGCGGGCGAAIEATEATEAEPATEPAPERPSESGAAPEAAEPVDPGPRPVLRVVGEPSAHDPTVAIRIENRGLEPTELARAVGLQVQDGAGFVDVDVHLDLRYSCDDEAPECVTLAPGATYLPPAWLGTTGDAQCECARCGAAPPGTYRFVVRSCSGAHTIEGLPFELEAG